MKNLSTITTYFVVCIFIFSSFRASNAESITAPMPETPIITESSKIENISTDQIFVKGLAPLDTSVLVYYNGQFIGLANISQGNSDYSLFSYSSGPQKKAENSNISIIAKNVSSGILSAPANSALSIIIPATTFSSYTKPSTISPISKPVVEAPVLDTPNSSGCLSRVYISGHAPSNSNVKIFIDDKLYTVIPTINKSRKDSFFSYSPTVQISRGIHSVYAIAVDQQGIASKKSLSLAFCLSLPQISTSSAIDLVTISTSTVTTSTNSESVFQKTTSSNSFNLSGFPHLNIIIFSLFIIGIIIWIFVINKQLLSEKQESKKN